MAELQTLKQKLSRQVQNTENELDSERQKHDALQISIKNFDDTNRQVSFECFNILYSILIT